MASVSPARRAAFDILLEMERRHAHSDDLLRTTRVEKLSTPDRNLTTALVLGVLRWQILLDGKVREHLDRPKAKLDPEVLIALRLGAFQLLGMDRVPAHAAIDESVELAKQAGHKFASRMVNAVLRKLPEGRLDSDGGAAQTSEVAAHPAWMVERWTKFYGADAARAICAHGQEQPASAVRIESTNDEAVLANAGVALQPGKLLNPARIVAAGEVTATAAFREGRVRLQDEGSQLVGELAGARGTSRRIFDACAAPGGKTMILAERNPEARIVACELSAPRLAQLKKRLAHFGDGVEYRLGDAATLEDKDAFDLVLADVPCSGTGTLGRNPEIRHRLRPEDLPRQAERQRAILSAAMRAARPGGSVVYSTCSLEPEENEEVVARVLRDWAGGRVRPMRERIEELRSSGILNEPGAEALLGYITREGFLRLLPGPLGTDGFFVALLAKE
jgi:16S rRNA (cytosine967-C5)-methyltransferase